MVATSRRKGAKPKPKGANGEREALRWFEETFGLTKLTRNLDQVRVGGADCLCIPHLALEVKRCETLELNSWWEQTVRQALRVNRIPVLMYRQNRRPWTFCLPASFLISHSWGFLTLRKEEFTLWYLDKLNGENHG